VTGFPIASVALTLTTVLSSEKRPLPAAP